VSWRGRFYGEIVSDTTGDDLTLQEAADVLGVHYMTAYRYVRLGLLPAAKAGGTWRVSRADLDLFQAGGPTGPQVDGGSRRRAPWAERLEARLLAGDARGAWGVIEAALAAGAELEEIYLDVLAPAMGAIGDRWERGELDVSLEHRASGIAMRLIGRLGPRFVRRGRTRGAVVLGAPAGERHALPVALVADLLRQHGWEVSDLGADVPDDSLVHAVVNTPDVVAVGVSVTSDDALASAKQAFTALRAATSGVALVVGGRAITSVEKGLELGADLVALDARGFAQLLEQVRAEQDEQRTDVAGN
jgi:excisionase family DNA binding protein